MHTDRTLQQCRWQVFSHPEALYAQALTMIAQFAHESISARGAFHCVLAGGSTPQSLYRQLRRIETDWSRWHIYYGDERCLPPADPARNSVMARVAWLEHVPIPAAQIHVIPAEIGAADAARQYARLLDAVDTFDLVLLGLGEDGHTASLFPGRTPGPERDAPAVIAVGDAPKPPPERVSLSARRLSQARHVVFIVTGSSKRAAVSAWRMGSDIPAHAIAPENGVDVLVDRDSWPS